VFKSLTLLLTGKNLVPIGVRTGPIRFSPWKDFQALELTFESASEKSNPEETSAAKFRINPKDYLSWKVSIFR
jgi:hypothetical protein